MAKDEIRSIFHFVSFYFSFKRFPVNALRRIALFFSLNKKRKNKNNRIKKLGELIICLSVSSNQKYFESIFLIYEDVMIARRFIYLFYFNKKIKNLFIWQ